MNRPGQAFWRTTPVRAHRVRSQAVPGATLCKPTIRRANTPITKSCHVETTASIADCAASNGSCSPRPCKRARDGGLSKGHGERYALAGNVRTGPPVPSRRAEPEVGMASFTYIGVAEDWLYGTVVLNLYSRRTVDWSIQVSMASVAAALMMAVWCEAGRRSCCIARPGQPVHQQACPEVVDRTRHRFYEPCWRRLGQRGDGELLQQPEGRVRGARDLAHTRASQIRRVRLHRVVQQPCAGTRRSATSAP